MLKIVRVWPSLGLFGWQVPWADWNAYGVYCHPPDDTINDYIWLYTLIGQMVPHEQKIAQEAVRAESKMPSRMKEKILIDPYVAEDGRVDWWALLRAIADPDTVKAMDAHRCNLADAMSREVAKGLHRVVRTEPEVHEE